MIPRVHLVTDDALLAAPDFERTARALLERGGGGVALHLRGPRSTGRLLWTLAAALVPVAERVGATLLLNDRVDVALAARAHGVHLGRRSLTVRDARALLPAGARVGGSAHGPDEVEALQAEGPPDFILLGTLFPTLSHPGEPGRGAEGVRATLEVAAGIPLVGIGGVTPPRVAEVLAAGGHGVAVMRAVWGADSPTGALDAFLAAVAQAHTPVAIQLHTDPAPSCSS